jgi:glycosyltransferase involved in cell wall biosynthesis
LSAPERDEGCAGERGSPLFSVGIPVYNGARTLGRAIESIFAQTERDLEIVVSDNASTDATFEVASAYAARDARVRVVRQPVNRGATANFMEALLRARGQYFMFLGHDDWIEPSYLEKCRESLCSPPNVALAAGLAVYHAPGVTRPEHRLIHLVGAGRSLRVLAYLMRVHDNGVFYGVARREDLLRLTLEPVMGADWLWVARLAFLGRVVTRTDVSIHRDLGGSTKSHAAIARALKLPAWQARFPRVTIALATLEDIVWKSPVYRSLPLPARGLLATAAGVTVVLGSVRDWAARSAAARGISLRQVFGGAA